MTTLSRLTEAAAWPSLIAGRVRANGKIVLSGILDAQAAHVAAAYARWFNIAPWGSAEGWVTLAGVRVAP